MRTIFIGLLMLTAVVAMQAQTQPKPLNDAEKKLCKTWKLTAIEEFHQTLPPGDDNKNDEVSFLNDRTIFLMWNNKSYTGTWELDKSAKWIHVTVSKDEKYKFQLLSISDTKMIYQYQDPELVRTNYTFEEKK